MANPGTIAIGILFGGIVLAFIAYAIYRSLTKNREQQRVYRAFGRPTVTLSRTASTVDGRPTLPSNLLHHLTQAFLDVNPRWSMDKAHDRALSLMNEAVIGLAAGAEHFHHNSPVGESLTVTRSAHGVYLSVTLYKEPK